MVLGASGAFKGEHKVDPSYFIKENDQGTLLKITDDAVALINGRKENVC